MLRASLTKDFYTVVLTQTEKQFWLEKVQKRCRFLRVSQAKCFIKPFYLGPCLSVWLILDRVFLNTPFGKMQQKSSLESSHGAMYIK